MVTVSGRILLVSLWALVLCQPWPALAAEDNPAPAGQERSLTPEQQAFIQKLQSLNWVKGPATVDVVGNSKLDIPMGNTCASRSAKWRIDWQILAAWKNYAPWVILREEQRRIPLKSNGCRSGEDL